MRPTFRSIATVALLSLAVPFLPTIVSSPPALAQTVSDRKAEADRLFQQGIQQHRVSQFREALQSWEQALSIYREIGNRQGEGNALLSLGIAYFSLGQYQQAIDLYEQQLIIVRDMGDRQNEGNALNNLGLAYQSLGQYQRAIDLYEQRLVIAREIGDRPGEGIALSNLGVAYATLKQYQRAIDFYQQSLSITQDTGNRALEGVTLSNIGRLLALQDQPELAIVFLKQSVNVRESIRGELRGAERELQQSYTDTIADDYRRLADLLLQQDRILEAQRILDLLKVQELEDYLQDMQRSGRTETGIELAAPEAQIRDRQQAITNRAIAIGQELAQLRQIDSQQRSSQQTARIAQLEAMQTEVVAEFEAFIYSDEVQALVAQLSRETRQQDLVAELDDLIVLQDNLAKLEQNAVLIYPLILEDRLELVLVTPNSPPTRYPVNVDRAQLNETIVAFRSALQDPRSNPQPIAQQLYEWLIAPMAQDLAAIDAQTILYAPDGVLRYIPLAALHDGNQWLAQNFRINNITAASLSDLNLQPVQQPEILAAAFEQGSFSFQVGERDFNFAGLPFAGEEVENLAATFPGTREYVDTAFTPDAIVPIMDDYSIVHLATHAAFVQGAPSDSFILFGNGDRITLEEIKTWRGRFRQVDLIVLSACETGVGESLGNGEEILGFGYLMQQAGARAAIASLWTVSDGGTQVLMNAFYAALENGHTKAEALQLAQQALITGDFSAVGAPRGNGTVVARDTRTGLSPDVSNNLSHPYYWAPFILIGNGL
ncbi:CHAT domain-containing protein [Microcoleus sp. FACHB-1515]|uniref:CHAT domain-containing protein n=1 Tax=Cyanophyceae TaxID=3028117 RepID=UPI0016894BAE|nr:CHAT domain-containing protein [Microcoleus sp. FACHB-1515]MBD2093475.1 CHAT domain-containing protein [Microcoleus sp. FACHB-1515]